MIYIIPFYMQKHFHVKHFNKDPKMMTSAVYLQVSIISQALIFVTRSRGWSFLERPGLLLVIAFFIAQMVQNFKVLLFHKMDLFGKEILKQLHTEVGYGF